MPDRYWVGDTDGDWNDANNWASSSGGAGGAGIPTSADAVIFDDQYTTQNCTCDVAIDIASLDVQSTYDGKLDFADSAYSHAIGGDATFAGTGEVDCGNATITIDEHFTFGNQGTWTRASSHIVLTGTSKIFTGKTTYPPHVIHDLTVSGSYIASVSGYRPFTVTGMTKVTGTLTLNTSTGTVRALDNQGTIDGDATLMIAGNTTNTGTISIATLSFSGFSHTIGPGTYSSPLVRFLKSYGTTITKTFGSGTVRFTGDLEVHSDSGPAGSTLKLDLETNNTSLFVEGDITLSEGVSVLDLAIGSGTVTFDGTTIYTDSTAAGVNLGNVEVAGDLTLASDLECDDFDGINGGALDMGGAYTLDASGDLDWATGFTVTPVNGCSVIVGGNFTMNGQTLTAASAAWYLEVTGTAVASGAGTVDYSDASGFTEIDASSGPMVDGLNNVNWSFGAAGPFPHYTRRLHTGGIVAC